MGDWWYGPDPDRPGQLKWLYDKDAPAASTEHTTTFPAVPPELASDFSESDEFADIYEREDGSIYGRVDPGEFESFDEVDSRTVETTGAPR